MMRPYYSVPEISDEIITLEFNEYKLTIYVKSLFRSMTVRDFAKMCKVISWACPDDEYLLEIAETLAEAITDSPRDVRAREGLLNKLYKMLLKRGLDLYV